MSSAPLLAINGPIATVTLNRPAERNRIEDSDLASLLTLFEALNANLDVRVVVVTANTAGQPKPVFSSGYDMAGLGAEANGPERFAQVADAWAKLRPVTVCALNGSVYGGATDWVISADLCVAQTGIVFKMPAAAIGFHYYPTGLQRYVARLGVPLTKRAFLTAQALPIEELAGCGLLQALVAPENLQRSAQEVADCAARLAPVAAQATKSSLNELAQAIGLPGEMTGGWARLPTEMVARMKASLQSRDFAEGKAAFAAKRAAQFEGC